jgi:hypothetical protein
MHRLTVVVVVAIAASAGLYFAPVTTRAQEAPSRPFSIGDTISLAYLDGGENRCLVGDVRGDFVRCDSGKDDTIGFNRPKVEYWYNLATVKYVSKSVAR